MVLARTALLLAMLTVACGGRAEDVVLRGYFLRAPRLTMSHWPTLRW
jgi:hypothetical protein